MMIRTLPSPSKLKQLLPLSLSSYTYTNHVSISIPSTFQPQINPCFQTPSKTPPPPPPPPPAPPFLTFIRPFCAQPSITFPALPISRDGNYDEATSQTLHICPGCGVPMQDSDPKKPGFYIKSSIENPITRKKIKNPNFETPTKENSVADESEISSSVQEGLLEPENPEDFENPKTHEHDAPNLPKRPLICSRCYWLRFHGRVRDSTIENLLPDFDFDHTVGRSLSLIGGARTVVLMVVDAVDFDGSFSRRVASLVSKTFDDNSMSWKEGKSGNVPRVVLVVTKIDLLPSLLSPTDFEHWVRTRAREGGANNLASVHLVSAVKDWGLKNLVDDVVELAGARGHVWVVGAQNAGKSTLINAIGKIVGGNVTQLTESPMPGTTLGIIRVEGVLPGQTKMFDTPGLLHSHQISTRLTKEEQKLVNISKELKPRTYRIKAGHSVHVAGLMRLDIEELSVDSIYVTVWASPNLSLHMGKTEKACIILEDHFGRQLKPPIGETRVKELGKWVRKEFRVSGHWWDSSSVDIAAAGLGWFAIGLKGEALLGVWTYDGVDVIVRNALIPQRAYNFEVAGFTVSRHASNKQRKNARKRKVRNVTTVAPDVSSS